MMGKTEGNREHRREGRQEGTASREGRGREG